MSDNANYYGNFESSSASKRGQVGLSIAKVYGYMFLGLLITAAIALGLGAYFGNVLLKDASSDLPTRFQSTNAIILLVLLITSFIGIIVLSFVVPITIARGRRSVLVPSIIYTVLMGIMLSTLAMVIDWSILGVTFGITALIFGLMSLIALLSKGRLNGLAIAAMGLFIGAGILSLVLWILMLVGFFSGTLYWIVSLSVFVAVMLITIWDMARIKAIAQNGEMTTNISLYCAFILYNDFIYIFLRILRIVILVLGNRR